MGVVAGLVVLLGFVAWRLSEGPVALNFLTPRLVEAFDMGEAQVSIEQTLLVWDDERSSLDLRVRGLTIADAAGQSQLVLPESNLELSIAALLSGEIQVVALEVFDAELRLTRDAGGRFGWVGSGTGDGSVLLGELLQDDATGEPGAANALSALQAVRLLRPVVLFDDQLSGRTLRLPGREILVERDPQGLSGSASLMLSLESEQSPLSVVFAYGRDSGLLDFSAELSSVSLPALSRTLPELAFLAALDARVGGAISATLSQASGLALIDFDFTLGPGTLHLGAGPERDVALAGGELEGLYDIGAGQLTVDRLNLVPRLADGSAGPALLTAGQLVAEGERRYRGALSLKAEPVTIAQLTELWPAWVSPGAHRWVAANLTEGRVDGVAAQVEFRLDQSGLSVDHLRGVFTFEQLAAHFLRPMTPVTELSGTGRFDDQGLTFSAAAGKLGSIALLPSEVAIYGLDGEDHRLRVAARGKGPIAAVLSTLEEEPLRLMSSLDLPLQGGRGEADFTLDLDMTLLGVVELADVAISAQATLSKLAFDEVYSGLPLSAERLSLQADKAGLRLRGPALLAGTPVEVDWQERFASGTTLTLSGTAIAIETVAALWPDLARHLAGHVSGSLKLDGERQRTMALDLSLDLTAASIELADIEWSKAAGTAANIALSARFERGRLAALEQLSFEAPGFSGAGRVAFTTEGSVSELAFDRLVAMGHSLRGLWARPWGEGWQLAFTGGQLDARPWLERLEGERDATPVLPLLIEPSQVDEVLLPGGSLVGATLAGERSAEGYLRLDLKGEVTSAGARGRIEVSMVPDAEGRRRLDLATSDMGGLLAALGIADNIGGGELRITAQASEPGATSRMAGQVEGTDFRLMRAPVLANVLLVASLTGIVDALDGEGISFSRLTGDIAFADGVLTSSLLKAYGGSLGITTKGSVDFGADVVDLEGSIVPAYAVNQVLGEIPVLGWILTGGEGGGLLAVTYRVSGPVSAPEISVNPLSALTPGFLRGLFDLFEGDGSSPPATLYPEGPTR